MTDPEPSSTQAVLFCAGRGDRLRPLTDRLPKPLVPIRGKPLLDYHLNALRDAGVRRVILTVNHLESMIRSHVGNGSAYDLEVQCIHQERVAGTGEALRSVASVITSDPFLSGYGDVFFGPRENVWQTLLRDRVPKVVVARIPDAGDYGRVITREKEGTDELESIREKDRQPTPGLVNAGAFLLPRDFLPLLGRIRPSPRGEIELTDALSLYVAKGRRVEVILADRWVDVGTPEALARAERMQ